jgi:hypothetical protein
MLISAARRVTPGNGLGLFDSGLDLNQWGWAELAAVAAGVYLLGSLIGDTKRGAQRVAEPIRRRSARRQRVAKLEEELSEARRGR